MAKKKTIKIEEPVELKKAPLLRNNVPDPVPSVLSGLLRFSPDHIVRLLYDPDSKNFLLGDLTQNLVTEGVMGESGGGGLVTQPCAVTFINNMNSPYSPAASDSIQLYTLTDGVLSLCNPYIDDNEQVTVSILPVLDPDYPDDGAFFSLYEGEGQYVLTPSNAVNCTGEEWSGEYGITITDLTMPSSITITVTHS